MQSNTVILPREVYDNLIATAGRKDINVHITLEAWKGYKGGMLWKDMIKVWNPKITLPEYKDFEKALAENVNQELAKQLEEQIRENTALDIQNAEMKKVLDVIKTKWWFKFFGKEYAGMNYLREIK